MTDDDRSDWNEGHAPLRPVRRPIVAVHDDGREPSSIGLSRPQRPPVSRPVERPSSPSPRDDDGVVIRHVRLCECGLPADHDSVCRPSRLALAQRRDQDWLDTLAHRGARRHAETEASERERFIAWLRGLDDLEVCRHALAPAVESTVPAGSLEPSRGGSEHAGPPRQQLRDDDPRVRLAKRQLRRAAEQLMFLRREEHGHGTAGAAVTMLGEHKDLEILRCEGAKPREVVDLLGRQIAGGSRTVERVREDADRCRWCGQHWPRGKGTI